MNCIDCFARSLLLSSLNGTHFLMVTQQIALTSNPNNGCFIYYKHNRINVLFMF